MSEAIAERSILGRVVRGSLLVAGGTVFLVGLLAVFVPDATESLPVGALIETLGSDYLVVAVVGLVAVWLALVVVLWRRLSGVDEATPPAAERVQSAPHPGTSFDRSSGGLLGRSATSTRERLREAAVRSLMRTQHRPRDAAERRIDDGTWTDDPVAARFLVDGAGVFSRLEPLGFGTGPVERTIDAIARVDAGVDADGSAGERARDRDRSEGGDR
ncbi:DUF7269 family protein [Halorubrum sp. DTA98]|uniref:DUF7269 family protein n=1 Tax=Halorubrum sp. DTA98 TaxID=3402163 RepID=UPI003AAD7B9D